MRYCLFCILVLGLAACHKTYDNADQVGKIALPPYSEGGAGTFGFLLDGSVWTVFGRYHYRGEIADTRLDNGFTVSSLNTGLGSQYQLTVAAGGRMSIVKNDTAITDIIASFNFTPTIPYVKSYYLTGSQNNKFAVNDLIKGKDYIVDSLNPFKLELTKFDKIDSQTRIGSGLFSGILYNASDKRDSIIITDGRFDTEVPYP